MPALNYAFKELVHLGLLALFLACALMGCASEPVVEAPKPRLTTSVRKPAPRELGSLWSEDSTWNNVYTLAAARVSGDIVTIRLDEAFKKRLVASSTEGREWEKRLAKAAAAQNGDRAPASTGPVDKTNPSDLFLRGNIEEVGTRGVYRITVGDTLHLNQWDPYVVLKGRVRDRDIDASDEIKVADIVDLEFEVRKDGQDEKETSDVSW
ncbi:flagellar basal body L-ring protein FlgH [bacterium]|nr:flagellar basal body L-ring protein FlgH [bacterium]